MWNAPITHSAESALEAHFVRVELAERTRHVAPRSLEKAEPGGRHAEHVTGEELAELLGVPPLLL